jgi:hypothetical protein
MNVLTYLNQLRPALPCSAEKPFDSEGKMRPMSNGELRRHLSSGAIMINGDRYSWDAEVPAVESLVFFPSSAKRRTTLV